MADLPVVVYHYPYSPYARRVLWYLALRGIPYSQCVQPPIMPRPDLARLGIRHRRVPVMSIGRDVYLDTRLQLQKLEAAFPSRPRLGRASTAEQLAVERLLARLMIDGGVFASAALLIPADLPLVRDPKFTRDRADFFGPGYSLADPDGRADAVNEIQHVAELLETGLLADGRPWILPGHREGAGPSLADIEAVWPFHWLITMPAALPADQVAADRFPLLFAWVARFKAAVSAARKTAPAPTAVDAGRALDLIVGSPFHEADGKVDAADGVVRHHGFVRGQRVTFWPDDTGSSGKDVGRLLSMDGREVVIETETEAPGGAVVRLHAPRHGFRVRPAAEEGPKL